MKKFLKVKKKKKKKLNENITGYWISVSDLAIEKFGFKNVWTYNGQILYKDNDGNKIKIYYE